LYYIQSLAILLSCALGLVSVDARYNGAPPEACATIEPQHPPNSQQLGLPKYSPRIENFPNRTYIPGQTYVSK